MGTMEHAAEHIATNLIDTHWMLKTHAREGRPCADFGAPRARKGTYRSKARYTARMVRPTLKLNGQDRQKLRGPDGPKEAAQLIMLLPVAALD